MKKVQKTISYTLAVFIIFQLIYFFPKSSAIWCCKDNFDKSRYSLTGNMAHDVAIIAKSQKGRTCTDFGYSGVDYGRWCDEYVADCIENAGANDSIVVHGGDVPDFESKMRARGAISVISPKEGDLVFFGEAHVEIITKVENGVPYCAGGNNGAFPGYCMGERTVSSLGMGGIHYLHPNYPDSTPHNNVVLSDGYYRIKSNSNDQYLIVDAGKYESGTNISVWPLDKDADEQIWEIISDEKGYQLCPKECEYLLGPENNLANVDTNIELRTCVWANGAQRWKSFEVEGGYVISPVDNPEVVLTVEWGHNVILKQYRQGDSTQIWTFEEWTPIYQFPDINQIEDLGDSFYATIYHFESGKNITAANNSNNVCISEYNDENNPKQVWFFQKQNDIPGTYKIMNVGKNQNLDAADGASDDYTNIQTWDDNGDRAQRWYIYKNGQIRPSYTPNVVMDLSAGSTAPMSNIWLYKPLNSGSQKWGIKILTNYVIDRCQKGHKWDNGEITTAATCNKDGVKTYTCTVCNATKIETIKATGHNYGKWEKLDDFQHQRVCANDNTHVEKENHAWDKGTITTAVTCTKDGVKTYTCTVCSATKTETIKSIGHNYGEWTKLDDTQHQRVCANDNTHVEKENHSWNNGEITKAATCTTDGVKTYTCTVCNATKTETIKAIGHNYGAWEKLDDAQHQRVCANDNTHVEKEKHAWDKGTITTAVTCTKDGVKTYTCTVCNATKNEAIKAIGHNYGAWEKLDETQHQRVCANDKTHVEKENHAWDEGKVTTEPTQTIEGVKTFTCTVCGATKTESIPKAEPERAPGDVDGDGKLTSADARLALRASVGLEPDIMAGSDAYLAADADGDGKVSSADARLILRASVGLEDPKTFGKRA